MQHDFETLLEMSVETHGHLCAGQVLGVRMSMLGLRSIAIEDPQGRDRKKLIVFVEIDRCATDAIQSVTGCTLGHRTMKYYDYGKMAATFVNLESGVAIRVLALEEARDKAKTYFPDESDSMNAQIKAYKIMEESDLFRIAPVRVHLRPEDLPGRPKRRVSCSSCGEYVADAREVIVDGKPLCKPCAHGAYFAII